MFAIMHRMDAIDTSDFRLCRQIDAESNEQTMFVQTTRRQQQQQQNPHLHKIKLHKDKSNNIRGSFKYSFGY